MLFSFYFNGTKVTHLSTEDKAKIDPPLYGVSQNHIKGFFTVRGK